MFKVSNYNIDYIDKYFINKYNDKICLTLIGVYKRKLHFEIKYIDSVINFFQEYLNKSNNDVCIQMRLPLCCKSGNYKEYYYIEFSWAAYNNFYKDEN